MSQHREVFTELVSSRGWKRGAELGVDKGILFHQLLRTCPELHLIGVDVFPVEERRERVLGIADKFMNRCNIFQMTTHDAADHVCDGSLDFVFIDADHAEPAVKDDIARWTPKVRSGGWLGGHDYNKKFPGVVRAVDKAFGKHVRQWPGSIWGVKC